MRRLAALLLILCLVFCLLPTMSAASGISVCFIAANDNLLELSYQPYWQGSTIYVPYTVFVNFKAFTFIGDLSHACVLLGQIVLNLAGTICSWRSQPGLPGRIPPMGAKA